MLLMACGTRDASPRKHAPESEDAMKRVVAIVLAPLTLLATVFAPLALAQSTVETPVLDPDGGTFVIQTNVTVTCGTEGATIHYTTDGNGPTESDASIGSGNALLVDAPLTLKAKAFKSEWTPSAVASAEF
jgi:hypothetical protein